MRQILSLGLVAAALTILGAGCYAQTSVTTQNTNVGVTTQVNTSVTNSSATGTFTTNANY